eukprot:Nk52_evm29s96 gene=Nk52_evmTU29s96
MGVSKYISKVRDSFIFLQFALHALVFLIDFTQVLPAINFLKREDGSASDPMNLLPIESAFVAKISLAMGTIAFAFALAYLTNQAEITFNGAAKIGVAYHICFILSLLYLPATWSGLFIDGPGGNLNLSMFYILNIVHLVMLSCIILIPNTEMTSNSTTIKSKYQ